MKILISGASRFIGLSLIKDLKEGGHEILALTRNVEASQKKDPDVLWINWSSLIETIDLKPYGKIDAVINLMGENIASKRWSNEQKKVIYNSRVDSTHTICKMIRESQGSVDLFISTSAIGIYGNRMSEEIHEGSLVVDDFMGKLCQDWEEALTKNSDIYNRHVIIRLGIVLGRNGGMMEKLLPIFNFGLGGKLGAGKHYMSWIHIEDVKRIFIRAIDNVEMTGVYNATSPFPVQNKNFTNYLGKILRKPTLFNVPKFLLKIGMGEMSEHVLSGARIIPRKLKEEGFHFIYPTLEVALKDVVSKEQE